MNIMFRSCHFYLTHWTFKSEHEVNIHYCALTHCDLIENMTHC